MCVTCTKWLPKPSHQMRRLYAYINSKQAKCGLLGVSRNIYYYLNVARKTGTRWKRKYCAIPVFIFVVRRKKSHHLPLCCIVKGSQNNDRRADMPRCCKCRYITRVKIELVSNVSIFLLMARDVVILFCRTDLTISFFSRALVMGER